MDGVEHRPALNDISKPASRTAVRWIRWMQGEAQVPQVAQSWRQTSGRWQAMGAGVSSISDSPRGCRRATGRISCSSALLGSMAGRHGGRKPHDGRLHLQPPFSKCQIGKRPSSAWRPLWRAMLVLAVLTVPDERGLCQNRAQSRDPHHMGDTGCYFSGPVVLPHLTITL